MEGLFGVVPEVVISDPTLTSTDVRVYAVLSMRAGARGWCWSSLRDLAEQARVSRASVCRSANRLVKAGFVAREHYDSRLIYVLNREVFNKVINSSLTGATDKAVFNRGLISATGGIEKHQQGSHQCNAHCISETGGVALVRPIKRKDKNKKTHTRTDYAGDLERSRSRKVLLPRARACDGVREGGGPEPGLSTGEAHVELDPDEACVRCTGAFARFSSEEVMAAVSEYSAAAVQTRLDQINRKAAKGLKIKDPIGYLVASFNKTWVNQ